MALLLAGCATRGPGSERDGVGAAPPPNLERTPDAVPHVEPIRNGGPNKPYEVFGRSYVPVLADVAITETGLASWYGRKYHARPTASGEPYDMYAMTAAHTTMPLPSYARVRNPANGREIVVRINDRGPFAAGRVIDLSYTAALKLGVLAGIAPVEVRRITNAEIGAGLAMAAAAPATTLPAETAAPQGTSPGDASAGQTLAESGYWLQLGAFRARESAAALQQRAQREAQSVLPQVAVREEESLYRVQAGPWATRTETQAIAEQLQRLLGIVPLLVQRR